MLRLLQITHASEGRRVALVDNATLKLVARFRTACELVQAAFERQTPLSTFLTGLQTEATVPYDDSYYGRSEWKILPPFDHPSEPARCLITGTGLTHIASADTRQKMHSAGEQETDSMRMYRWGVEGGRPPAGSIGKAPEWFYKGNGSILRAHGEPLTVPPFAEDGGEEPEIAGVYLVDQNGQPRRVGLTIGNEFSDHKTERQNYLYLAHSKLRQCSIGPELIVDPDFASVPGIVQVERKGEVIWRKEIASGEQRMSHSLANLEHHHFKYPEHRRPDDIHIHFFGADAFSFGAGVELKNGDVVQISFEGFGRPLRNPIEIDSRQQGLVVVNPA